MQVAQDRFPICCCRKFLGGPQCTLPRAAFSPPRMQRHDLGALAWQDLVCQLLKIPPPHLLHRRRHKSWSDQRAGAAVLGSGNTKHASGIERTPVRTDGGIAPDPRQPAGVLAAVTAKPCGGPKTGPASTAAARAGRTDVRARTKEWLLRGPN
ncbi:MAG: hypothetical protein JO122_15925 [Acetobacteraceae bacterium]|nr:hypothetical protein [Acetobacteraceae bacterium]